MPYFAVKIINDMCRAAHWHLFDISISNLRKIFYFFLKKIEIYYKYVVLYSQSAPIVSTTVISRSRLAGPCTAKTTEQPTTIRMIRNSFPGSSHASPHRFVTSV